VTAALYDADYARRYRTRDEELESVGSYHELVRWIGEVCDRFDHPIDVLDLGCGTGRYFWGLRNVDTLTGLDASEPMLVEAAQPTRATEITARTIALVKGDLSTHSFADNSFDLVYSIGVLAEHVPLTRTLVARVARWLRSGGRFAFTTIDPQSPDVPKTMQRRIATSLLPITPGAAGESLHRRLMVDGMYADQRWIRAMLDGLFTIESIDRFQSDVHLHGRCIARLRADASAGRGR
jgi:ubiquinone/menaquinone biosynthesis C-methylase UbiE